VRKFNFSTANVAARQGLEQAMNRMKAYAYIRDLEDILDRAREKQQRPTSKDQTQK
jgi:hypothetical protein